MPYPTGRCFRQILTQALRARLRSVLSLRDALVDLSQHITPSSKSLRETSRSNSAIVAWHELPGKHHPKSAVPEGRYDSCKCADRFDDWSDEISNAKTQNIYVIYFQVRSRLSLRDTVADLGHNLWLNLYNRPSSSSSVLDYRRWKGCSGSMTWASVSLFCRAVHLLRATVVDPC